MEAKDVEASISGDILTIKGEKKKQDEETGARRHHVERYAGAFQRTLQLPIGVKAEEIKAIFDRGVLRMALPKVEEAEKRQIAVKAK